ncbi:DIP1984 family protein [Asaia lannensis]|uniref:DIP1984 family protein n=1 Tax=Asaia lannensis NBRC 102526 TaxID=1307926 RepID=A0ABT1CGZ7_9PROT|nr:DIP1984 family protein [Asaia lannensis]MCO6160148.1 DIP1984 family protein [Asaia lannensis NBRC 102526]
MKIPPKKRVNASSLHPIALALFHRSLRGAFRTEIRICTPIQHGSFPCSAILFTQNRIRREIDVFLAEALTIRSDLAKKLEQLKARLLRNAKVQEGDTPAEDPNELLLQYDRDIAELQLLIARINATNASTVLDNGMTMTQALAERDMLRLRVATFRDLAKEATVTQSRITKSEVRFCPTVSVAEVQKRVDTYSKKLRLLEVEIQKHNWNIELE